MPLTSGQKRAAWILGGLFTLSLFVFSEKIYQFDGIMFASMIESMAQQWTERSLGMLEVFRRFSRDLFQYTTHYLYPSTALLVYRFFSSIDLAERAYPSLQVLSRLCGGALIFFLFRWLARRHGTFPALLGCGALGFSNNFFLRGSEGQVYMVSAMWTGFSLLAACSYAEIAGGTRKGSPLSAAESRRATRCWIAAAAANTVACFYHLSNGLSALAISLWLVATRPAPRWRRDFFLYWLILGGALFLAIGMPRRLYHWPSFKKWLFQDSLGSAKADEYKGGYLVLPGLNQFRGAGRAFWQCWYANTSAARRTAGWYTPSDAQPLAWVSAAILFSLTIWLLRRAWPLAPPDRAVIGLCGAVFLFYMLFYAGFTPGIYHFKIWAQMAMIPALVRIWHRGLGRPMESGSDLPPAKGRWVRPILAAAVGLLVLHNGVYSFWHFSRPQSNPEYHRALTAGKLTPANGLFILSGVNWTWGKVYLPYFAQRNRLALDLYLYGGMKKEELLRQMGAALQQWVGEGRPLYLLSEMFEPDTFQVFSQKWGLRQEELMAVLDRYARVEIGRQDDGFIIYEIWPKQAGVWSARQWNSVADRLERAGTKEARAAAEEARQRARRMG